MTEERNDGQSKHLMPPCHFMAGHKKSRSGSQGKVAVKVYSHARYQVCAD